MTGCAKGFHLRLLIFIVVVSFGCSDGEPTTDSQSTSAGTAGLSSGRVGWIRVGDSLESVLHRATLIGDELRTSIGGGDLDRYLRVVVEGDTLEIVPSNGRVREIVVRSARWRTSNGLGVGTSALELSRHELLATAYSANGLIVNVRAYCGIDFALGEARVQAGHIDDEITPDRLALFGDSVFVTMVVVRHAC